MEKGESTMDIGKRKRVIFVEPLEAPTEVDLPAEEPEPTKDPVPAKE